jgi:hypothetical protein
MKTTFREYDMVALLRAFPEYGLEAGAVGCLCDLKPGAASGYVEFPGPTFPLGGIVEIFALADLRPATAEEIAEVGRRNEAVNWDEVLSTPSQKEPDARAAARKLADLGSSDSGAKAPPRRRPD